MRLPAAKSQGFMMFVVNGRNSRSTAPSHGVVAKLKIRRSLGSCDILRKIELIEQPKQLASRGADSRHAVGAGEFRCKFLLPENEDFKFGYGVHSASFASSGGSISPPP
jgi:hypothetical protein